MMTNIIEAQVYATNTKSIDKLTNFTTGMSF